MKNMRDGRAIRPFRPSVLARFSPIRVVRAWLGIALAIGLAAASSCGGAEQDAVDTDPSLTDGTSASGSGAPAGSGANAGPAGGTDPLASATAPSTDGMTSDPGQDASIGLPGADGCAAGEAMCGGVCANLMQDSQNCGECGTECPAGSGCADGGCSCLVGFMSCGGVCIDVAEDPDNCGVCGNACQANEVCSQGVCSADGCGDGLTACEGSCIDTQSDSFNCGGCGRGCGANQMCEGGECVCSGESCDGFCVNLDADPSNCGQCGNQCPSGILCDGGSCQCPNGQTPCNQMCVNTMTHTEHCGQCGNACGLGEFCTDGSCGCPEGQMFCGSGCVTVTNNALHCGACDNACTSGVCRDGSCGELSGDDAVVGWASVSGNGVDTTTGGGGASPTDVNSASELSGALSDATPQVIRVASSFSGQVQVSGSNKTIVGANADVTLSGGIQIENASNIIVRNLRINGRSSSEDGIVIDNSHHVWIDHVQIWDAPDGNLDIKNAADLITISWSHFYYSDNPPNNDHRFSNLIGSGDGDTQDRGHLRVTWHHNWWGDRVHERMPRVRFGQVHVFNNYYSSSGNNYCIRAGFEASILVENNYFDNVDTPHEIDGAGSSIVADGNVYTNTTGAQDESGSAFDPAYDYSMDPANDIPDIVRAGAGPP